MGTPSDGPCQKKKNTRWTEMCDWMRKAEAFIISSQICDLRKFKLSLAKNWRSGWIWTTMNCRSIFHLIHKNGHFLRSVFISLSNWAVAKGNICKLYGKQIRPNHSSIQMNNSQWPVFEKEQEESTYRGRVHATSSYIRAQNMERQFGHTCNPCVDEETVWILFCKALWNEHNGKCQKPFS